MQQQPYLRYWHSLKQEHAAGNNDAFVHRDYHNSSLQKKEQSKDWVVERGCLPPVALSAVPPVTVLETMFAIPMS